jgi:hypothetical protein
VIAGFAASAASLSAAHAKLLDSGTALQVEGGPQFETSALIVQDTTKKIVPPRPDLRMLNQGNASSLPQPSKPVSPFTLRVDRLGPKLMTLDDADSLGKLYPELKDFLLKQLIIQGALALDQVEFEKRKTLGRMFADLKLYGEMEAAMRHNQAVYGTPNNPLRPPPMPNQVNLLDLLPAISNLLRALGLK